MEQSKAIGQKVKQIHHSSCIQLCRLRYSSPLLIHKLLLLAYHPEKLSARGSFSEKTSIPDDHFDPQFSFMATKGSATAAAAVTPKAFARLPF
jgi:hypothetical protein